MEFFNKTGKMALGSRLRILSSQVTQDASKIYQLYKVEFSPKWFPVFFILSKEGAKTITEIAEQIGHTQPSVTKIAKEMTTAGLIENNLQSDDKRRNVITLTTKGVELSNEIIDILGADIDLAIDGIIDEAALNLWEALAEWEVLLQQKTLFQRVQEVKKARERGAVKIVAYEPKYHIAFRSLNIEWISKYFKMEETDYKALDNPQNYILNNGGKIFVALYQGEPLGVCALIKMEDPEYDYELAKMAVSPSAQGKSIGTLLGNAIIQSAKELGASKIYLESNTVLAPAIQLYYKLGFQKITGRHTPYQRCNIQMELNIKD